MFYATKIDVANEHFENIKKAIQKCISDNSMEEVVLDTFTPPPAPNV